MDISEKKKAIIDRIEGVNEEWLIRAIEKLLDITDADPSPDWHLPIVAESQAQYQANPAGAVKWEDLKKEWDHEL